MNKQKPKSSTLRVPFKCNLAPTTKELITGIQNQTKESQGEIVDRAVALLALGEEVAPVSRKKPNRKEKAIQERESGDITAKAVEREDIDYSDVESTPASNVANLRGTTGAMSAATRQTVDNWRRNRRPILKPKDR